MTLEQVKKETIEKLIKTGYSREQAEKTASDFVRISGYYKGRPSRVITKNGIELYLF